MQTFELSGKTYQIQKMDDVSTVAVILKKGGEVDKRFKPKKFNTSDISHLLGDAETEQLVISFDETATPTATDEDNKYLQILENGLLVGMSDKAVTTLLIEVRKIMVQDGQDVKAQSVTYENCTAHYYGFEGFYIQFTLVFKLGKLSSFDIKIQKGNIVHWALLSYLSDVAKKATQESITLDDIHNLPEISELIKKARIEGGIGELVSVSNSAVHPENWRVYMGSTTIAQNLFKRKAVLLHLVLQTAVYQGVYIAPTKKEVMYYVNGRMSVDGYEECGFAKYHDLAKQASKLYSGTQDDNATQLIEDYYRSIKDIAVDADGYALCPSLDKFVDEELANPRYTKKRVHTHDSVKNSDYYAGAVVLASYHADSGEEVEYYWCEDTNLYNVNMGCELIVEDLDETEAEILADHLNGHLYNHIELVDSDNYIKGYVEGCLFNGHIAEKATALYGYTEHDELVADAYLTYSTALRKLGSRAVDNPEKITYHSLEKHLDLLLSQGDSHGENDFYAVSSYMGKLVIVCQKPFLHCLSQGEFRYLALALVGNALYVAHWTATQSEQATPSFDISNIAHMQKL